MEKLGTVFTKVVFTPPSSLLYLDDMTIASKTLKETVFTKLKGTNPSLTLRNVTSFTRN